MAWAESRLHPHPDRLPSQKITTASFLGLLIGVLQGPCVFGLSTGDSITAEFAQRAELCYSARGHGLDGAECGHEFTIGASYAIRLLSDPPTKTTEDAIRKACDAGCMHAVLSEVTGSFRDDTICAQSTHGKLTADVLVGLGHAVCASYIEAEGGRDELCLVGVTKVLRDRGILESLVRMDGSFAWPEEYQMMAMCAALQRVGCCAPTFQAVATAFFMAECSIANALQMALLSQRCTGLGTPIDTEMCNMAGVDRDSWLVEYNPYGNSSVLHDTELFCASATSEAVTKAVNADSGHGCWPDACALVHGVLDAAQNLGIRSAEAMTYIIMLVSSFAVLCVCVCSTCFLSWIMHRLDAKGRKLYMPGPEDGAPDPHEEPIAGKFIPT